MAPGHKPFATTNPLFNIFVKGQVDLATYDKNGFRVHDCVYVCIYTYSQKPA